MKLSELAVPFFGLMATAACGFTTEETVEILRARGSASLINQATYEGTMSFVPVGETEAVEQSYTLEVQEQFVRFESERFSFEANLQGGPAQSLWPETTSFTSISQPVSIASVSPRQFCLETELHFDHLLKFDPTQSLIRFLDCELNQLSSTSLSNVSFVRDLIRR